MKLQCELCREIVVAELAIDGARIAVSCPACKGTFTVLALAAKPAVAKSADPEGPIDPYRGPSMHCPKCGLEQRQTDACRACGLLASRMADFGARDLASAPAEVAAAWHACTEAWAEPARHDELVRAAAAHDAYPWVARRYHDRLRADPGDAIAAARQGAIARIAEASLRAGAVPRETRPPGVPGAPSPTPYRATMTVLIGLVVLAATGTIYAMVTSPSSSDTATAAPIPVQPQHRR